MITNAIAKRRYDRLSHNRRNQGGDCVQKIKHFLISCMAVGLMLSQCNLPVGYAMRAINAQTPAYSSQLNTPENAASDESSESSSDIPPEPPKDFEPPVESSSDTPSESPVESSTDETNPSESSIESSESSSDETSQESETSQSSSESSNNSTSQEESTPDETTPVQNILPGSLMIKPMNMLEPVNVPTTVRKIINHYGDMTSKLFRILVPFGQLLVFPYEGEIISMFNLTLIDFFENILGTISN